VRDNAATAEHARPRLRVCLAASGGGHLRQLLDLEPAWARHNYFFLTEDTALGRSIAEKHPARFVEHVALGQAKLGKPFRMAAAGVKNFLQSARIILTERPDVVISTGAGAVFFAVLWGRMTGAKVVAVESFARFTQPSAFMRLAAPIAHVKVVQSPLLKDQIRNAEVYDPLEVVEAPRPAKAPLLFATVGATLPFDRLVGMVAELKARGEIPEDIVVQSGLGGLAPEGLEVFETLPFGDMQARLRDAEIVVCHGGTGSLITALQQGCRTIAVPRLFERGEHYDNHQADIAEAFAARGLIEVAHSTEQLSEALKRVRAREPVLATTNPVGLIGRLESLLSKWARERGKSA
jgi:UDP-N-acetylglucosamine--N-acetylmuramyl-(pentapeptide) pyrophosphoryl-undecaprenol N-acetylglucosamine transferase